MKKIFTKIFLIFSLCGVLCFSAAAFAADKIAEAPKDTEILTEAEKAAISVNFIAINEKIKQITDELNQDTISVENIDEYVSFLSTSDAQLMHDRKYLEESQIKPLRKLTSSSKSP